MYDLNRSEEQTTLVELVHAFAEKELRPAARDAEKARAVPVAVGNALHTLGVACPISEAFDGQGVPDLVTYLMIAEELAWGDPGIAYAALGAGHAALLIGQCGSREQQRAWLPRFTEAAPAAGSVLLYEGFGRAPSELRTRAEKTPAGWLITGAKAEVLYPAAPDVAVIVARRTDTGALAAFAAAGPLAGVLVTRDNRSLGRIGLCAATTGALELASVVLPENALLAGISLGLARAAKDTAAAWVRERESEFTRERFVRIEEDFTRMEDALVHARRLVLRACWMKDQGLPNTREAAAAKAYGPPVAERVIRRALQSMGPDGASEKYLVEKWHRDVRIYGIFEGSGQVMCMTISRDLMGAGAARG